MNGPVLFAVVNDDRMLGYFIDHIDAPGGAGVSCLKFYGTEWSKAHVFPVTYVPQYFITRRFDDEGSLQCRSRDNSLAQFADRLRRQYGPHL